MSVFTRWYGLLLAALFFCLNAPTAQAQQSVARRWNEALLQSIREDFARPPVHARNLYYVSVAMYDAWAAYDTTAETAFLGKQWGNYFAPFDGVPAPADVEAARNQAISFAAYRVLRQRFQNSPNANLAFNRFNNLMADLGYNGFNNSTDYSSGDPAALGNYIGNQLVSAGLLDGSNEANNYAITNYAPVNPVLEMAEPGNPNVLDPNRWQALKLVTAIDQAGNPIPATQVFQSPEWGRVLPFAMTTADCDTFQRAGVNYYVYHDPGAPAQIDTTLGGDPSEAFKWNHELVTIWQSHHNPYDEIVWDISPASLGNLQGDFPQTLEEYQAFYQYDGTTPNGGHAINPHTGQPYTPQYVPRGDYTRVLAQYWADGPTSETPPGHWYTILNYVNDRPELVRRFNGQGPLLNNLEWDVKCYLTLGGTVHDAAIAAWGIKGWYDSSRPVAALRYMSDKGQSSDPGLPRYHPAGVRLEPGFIEMVLEGDPLAGANNENVGKIKFYTWRGPDEVVNPSTDFAGVGWILAENWWPYQRKTFVTPPFAGFISGHSTYSRAAAEVLTRLTGDAYFPGGMGEFHIGANSGFLGLEQGPSVPVTLQWATYRDASDQTSLSRIWGGIHPPMDDIPGRIVGTEVAIEAFEKAKSLFYNDLDNDGFFSFEDCDDHNASIYPNAPELCDGIDNNCNGLTDDGLTIATYYADLDGDGYGGTAAATLDTCLTTAPSGFAANALDCDDANADIHPGAAELCDGIDNDCNGLNDDGLELFTFYFDLDGDGFGTADTLVVLCLNAAPSNFVANADDCNDSNADIHPGAAELCDGIDNDCNGLSDDGLELFTFYLDLDGDGFGTADTSVVLCVNAAPVNFVANALDCDDQDENIHPDAPEVCDGIDNNCNGLSDDGLEFYTLYLDADADGFGNADSVLLSCVSSTLTGYATNNEDCDDGDTAVNPAALEIFDDLDNDCNGEIDDVSSVSDLTLSAVNVYPNPIRDVLYVQSQSTHQLSFEVTSVGGQAVFQSTVLPAGTRTAVDFTGQLAGVYFLRLIDLQSQQVKVVRVVKI